LDTKDGISLLSLKHHIMLSYIQALTLLCAQRMLGQSLNDRASTSTQQAFSSSEREARGSQPGDLVDSLIENRIVLEKVKILESKMRYQIQKLVRLAEESPTEHVTNDPLAFRPNPQALMDQESEDSASSEEDNLRDDDDRQRDDGIYRPPKLAPVPYTEGAGGKRDKKERKRPVPTALAHLASQLDPYMESTSGLGGGVPSMQSSRARELDRMREYEEENFTRLVMKKKDARARRRDEEDIALGGTGMASRTRGRGPVGGGFDGEFEDVLRAVNRKREGPIGDGYEELRQRGKKGSSLARSRMRPREEMGGDANPRERKKGKFETDRLTMKKKLSGKKRR